MPFWGTTPKPNPPAPLPPASGTPAPDAPADASQTGANVPTDARLVAAFRAGDPRAFDQLYDRYAARVLAYTRHLTGSAADAEDLTQETFLAAVRALPGYRENAAFGTWLLGIAVRRWRDRKRARARRPADNPVPDDLPEPRATRDPLRAVLIRAALADLPDDKRAAFLLVAHAGLTYPEAAQTLGVPRAVVKWRVGAAAKQLRRALSDAETETEPNAPLKPKRALIPRLEELTDV